IAGHGLDRDTRDSSDGPGRRGGGPGRRGTIAGRAAVGAAAAGSSAAGSAAVAGVGVGVEARADAELLLDPLLDLVGQVRVVAEEVAGVFLALAELVAVVGVPSAGLAHDPLLHAQVDQAAFPADADAVK